MVKKIFIFSFIILSGLSSRLYSAKAYTFGPVITFANKKMNDMTLLFYSSKKKKFNISISNNLTNFTLKDKGPRNYHRYKIDIKDFQSFYYRIKNSGKKQSFKQAMVQIPSSGGYSFAVIGQTIDTRGVYWNMVHLFEKIKRHRPAYLLHTGNIVHDSFSLSKWSQYFNHSDYLMSRMAFIPNIGSADFYSVIWRRLFDVSNKRQPFYSYSLPLAHILVVNSSMYFATDSSQYRWLKQELEKIKDDKWKILMIHHAPYESITAIQGIQSVDLLGDIVPLLKKYKIDLILTGSHQYYERSLYEGITVINSGGMGPALSQIENPNPYRKVMISSRPHFVIGHISTRKLTLTAYDGNNKKLDAVTLSK